MTTRIVVCFALLTSPAFGISIEFQDEANGDYRIVRIDDIDGGDGFIYSVEPQTMTYEELQGVHTFDYPADAVRQQITQGFAGLEIPLSLVRQEPEKTYWLDQPWTERMDATYEVGFMVNCDTATCDHEYLTMRGWEWDTLGASLGDSWTIPYRFAVVTAAAVPEPSSLMLLLFGFLLTFTTRRA